MSRELLPSIIEVRGGQVEHCTLCKTVILLQSTMLGSVGMMLVVSLVFIDRDLITINHASVCGHDASYVISVYRP